MIRIITTSDHLNESRTLLSKVSQVTSKLSKNLDQITSNYEKYKEKLSSLSDSESSLAEMEVSFENWLTDIELKMIRLRPYSLSIENRTEQLQELYENIEEKVNDFEEFNQTAQQPSSSGCSSEDDMENLYLRFHQVGERMHIHLKICGVFRVKPELASNSLTSVFIVRKNSSAHQTYIPPFKREPHKWSNTLKQQPANCLRLFDHFVGLVLKGLT